MWRQCWESREDKEKLEHRYCTYHSPRKTFLQLSLVRLFQGVTDETVNELSSYGCLVSLLPDPALLVEKKEENNI